MDTLILHGAVFWTGVPDFPAVEAVAVSGDRIIAVGTLEACRKAAPQGDDLDLGGGFVMPGFNDNHLHTAAYGRQLNMLSLRGMTDAQILEALQRRFAGWPAGRLIEAVGWDYDHVPEPHARILDAAFPHNPVILIQFSGHAAWVNTRVLKRLGITAKTADPPGGVIVRDAEGAATGVIRDEAVVPLHQRTFVDQHIRISTLERDIRRALKKYAMMGITSVQDNTWLPPAVWVLRGLYRRGRLSCRFSCWPHAGFPKLRYAMERLTPYRHDWYRLGPRKYFLDGSFSTQTAWLMEPYTADSRQSGVAVMTESQVAAALRSAARDQRQAAFHAIGDRAVHEFLNVFESLVDEYPQLTRLRIRLEHGQLILPEDIPRVKRLGVLIASQPHAAGDYAKDLRLVGEQRARRAYPYRALLDAGVPLSFGSDIPGEATVHPLYGIQLAAAHPVRENISVEEAMSAYTHGSAYAEFQEEQKYPALCEIHAAL
ncbi:MAG: amidohydrolase, partial [Spirochaeta sp.]